AHNGLDLSMGGMLDIIVEPYNQALIDSAVITWGDIDANGDLTFSVTFDIDEEIPLHEYTIQLNVVTLDGGIAHAASVAFVTESSTLDGTAMAADSSVVVSGNTSQHDGKDTAVEDVGANDGDSNSGGNDEGSGTNDDKESDSQNSKTFMIVGSTIGVLGVVAGIAVVVLRGRNGGGSNKDFSNQLWNEGAAQPAQSIPQTGMMQQPVVQQPVVQEPAVQQPAVQQPVAQPAAQPAPVSAPAPPAQVATATAPPPPAQPTTVADYTGLPPGGQYDQSTGQTVYVQQDGVRWQMMPDGSFNRLG
ncbi:MAG: hypothetical protein QF531_04740, partial [Candidatus Poseidonia sp.]|nr:hypothetical protein [Poseidonia sp.]